MSLNKVVDDILRRGEERKREIIRLGEKDRDEQVLLAEKKIEENRKKAEVRNRTMISQLEQQEMSSAELEAKKVLLAAQRQVMEELREQVLAELAGYPADKRRKLYSKLVARAKKELGDCYVYSNEGDKALLQLQPGMANGGVINCRGGLVFESKDRSIRLDFRFESLLDDVWNRKMQEIFGKLSG
ncbi:MAG: V-type ATP synthase subunit E family protein [Thermoplasmata archaeon]